MHASDASVTRLNAYCARCGHSEFIHSDQPTALCLFNSCDCLRLLPMPEVLFHEAKDVGIARGSAAVARRSRSWLSDWA